MAYSYIRPSKWSTATTNMWSYITFKAGQNRERVRDSVQFSVPKDLVISRDRPSKFRTVPKKSARMVTLAILHKSKNKQQLFVSDFYSVKLLIRQQTFIWSSPPPLSGLWQMLPYQRISTSQAKHALSDVTSLMFADNEYIQTHASWVVQMIGRYFRLG